MFIKITNLVGISGQCDYKGLDLLKIVPTSQLYPDDKNEAYFRYDGDIQSIGDIQVITESEYLAEKERIENLPRPKTELDLLKEENASIRLEMARSNTELFEMMVAMTGGIA